MARVNARASSCSLRAAGARDATYTCRCEVVATSVVRYVCCVAVMDMCSRQSVADVHGSGSRKSPQ
eukprot:2558474-Prymnesium_polylepis.1